MGTLGGAAGAAGEWVCRESRWLRERPGRMLLHVRRLLLCLLFSRFFRLRFGLGQKELHGRDGDKYQKEGQHEPLLSAGVVLGIVIFGQVLISVNFFWARGHSRRAPEGCNEVSAIRQEQLHELPRGVPLLPPRTQSRWAHSGKRRVEEAKSAAYKA